MDKTFTVQVDGVGAFECRRRTMRVQVAIAAEYNRLVEGAESISRSLDSMASFMSYLQAMIVDAPEGWDAYAVDPDDPDEVEQLQQVYAAIQAAEARFRKGRKPKPEAASEGAVEVD